MGTTNRDYSDDHEAAARELCKIVERHGLQLETIKEPRPKGYSAFPIKFVCTVSSKHRPSDAMDVPFSSGVGNAEAAYRKGLLREDIRPKHREAADAALSRGRNRLTVWMAEGLDAIYRAYEPEPFDVVASMLNDARSAEDTIDWLEWSDEFGHFNGETSADELRELRDAFTRCKQGARMLKQTLGSDDYGRAIQLVCWL